MGKIAVLAAVAACSWGGHLPKQDDAKPGVRDASATDGADASDARDAAVFLDAPLTVVTLVPCPDNPAALITTGDSSNYSYMQMMTTVPSGEVVEFQITPYHTLDWNNGNAVVAPEIPAGSDLCYAFPAATYNFHCYFHAGDGMTGTLLVSP